jgi:hypothetical protein
MQSCVFSNCPLLKSVILPRSLSKVDGSCFHGSSIDNIEVDSGNTHFFVTGDFLIAFEGTTLIRYFGLITDLVVPSEYETLGSSSFSDCNISSIAFEAGSRITRIQNRAFEFCTSLKAICIAASVEFLGEACFMGCKSLIQLTFESGCRLTEIGKHAFENCSSICIPAQVEFIPPGCFNNCSSLAGLSFEGGSKLTGIAPGVLAECISLRVITFPASMEVIEASLFVWCNSLRQLIFEMSSRLRELGLPPSAFDPLCIPDSVEVLSADVLGPGRKSRVLQFGQESRLKRLRISSHSPSYVLPSLPTPHPTPNSAFVRLHENTLRRFRPEFESHSVDKSDFVDQISDDDFPWFDSGEYF